MPSYSHVTSVEDRRLLGMSRGHPLPDPYSARWDKRDGVTPTDLGDIGEDHDGVWACIHPLIMLADDPLIWDIISEVQLGQTRLTQRDFEAKSSFEYLCKLELSNALRRVSIPKPKGGSDD